MEVETITSMLETISKQLTLLQGAKKMTEGNIKKYYTDKDLTDTFNISSKTLSRWRNEGLIGYAQCGDKRIYTTSDIDSFIEKHHVDAFA